MEEGTHQSFRRQRLLIQHPLLHAQVDAELEQLRHKVLVDDGLGLAKCRFEVLLSWWRCSSQMKQGRKKALSAIKTHTEHLKPVCSPADKNEKHVR